MPRRHFRRSIANYLPSSLADGVGAPQHPRIPDSHGAEPGLDGPISCCPLTAWIPLRAAGVALTSGSDRSRTASMATARALLRDLAWRAIWPADSALSVAALEVSWQRPTRAVV